MTENRMAAVVRGLDERTGTTTGEVVADAK